MAMRREFLLLVACVMLAGVGATHIECPSFIEQIHDESEVLRRFKTEIASGSLKSIHQK